MDPNLKYGLTSCNNSFILNFLWREDIDNWEIRKGVNELYGHDLVPEPRIVNAMLKACRRLDDFGMAVRVLEIIKLKCQESGEKEIYNYIIQSCKPVMDELGVETVESLGLAKS